MLSLARQLLKDTNIDFAALVEVQLPENRFMASFSLGWTDDKSALPNWQNLAKEAPAHGLQAILLGDAESFSVHIEALGLACAEESEELSQATSVSEILEKAANLNYEDWIAERLEEHVYEPGEWPESVSVQEELPLEAWAEDGLYGALIECDKAAQLPAWLLFGGFAECPSVPAVVANLSRWQSKYEVTPFCVTQDSLICHTSTQPKSKEEATALAREHFAFAPEVVNQPDSQISLATYAAALQKMHYWLFTWT